MLAIRYGIRQQVLHRLEPRNILSRKRSRSASEIMLIAGLNALQSLRWSCEPATRTKDGWQMMVRGRKQSWRKCLTFASKYIFPTPPSVAYSSTAVLSLNAPIDLSNHGLDEPERYSQNDPRHTCMNYLCSFLLFDFLTPLMHCKTN